MPSVLQSCILTCCTSKAFCLFSNTSLISAPQRPGIALFTLAASCSNVHPWQVLCADSAITEWAVRFQRH
jgi:hypothetical protein